MCIYGTQQTADFYPREPGAQFVGTQNNTAVDTPYILYTIDLRIEVGAFLLAKCLMQM